MIYFFSNAILKSISKNIYVDNITCMDDFKFYQTVQNKKYLCNKVLHKSLVYSIEMFIFSDLIPKYTCRQSKDA